MPTHPRRLALALAIAGTLAGGALTGPAMAASDHESPVATDGKAGGDEHMSMRKSGGEPPAFVTLRKAGGEPIGYIIGVL
jgi:hypothetical protein